jgi:hypothetical protein
MGINQQGKWLSVLDYAHYRQISVSTVRRYIKSKTVQSKLIKGKYLIWAQNYYAKASGSETQIVEQLKHKISLLEEENQELRMLISVYENHGRKEKITSDLPELPVN